jgi:hypothetical protein
VPGDHWEVREVEVAFAHVEVGPTAPACVDTDPHFVGRGLGVGALLEPQRPFSDRCGAGEDLGSHDQARVSRGRGRARGGAADRRGRGRTPRAARPW